MAIQCPVCGSDKVTEELLDHEVTAPHGPTLVVKLYNDKCQECHEEGDYLLRNDVLLEAALAESTQKSIPVMIQKINQLGYSNIAAERELRLEFGTFDKWIADPASVSPASVALLRLVVRHPNILKGSGSTWPKVVVK